jgi:hypothetical protein
MVAELPFPPRSILSGQRSCVILAAACLFPARGLPHTPLAWHLHEIRCELRSQVPTTGKVIFDKSLRGFTQPTGAKRLRWSRWELLMKSIRSQNHPSLQTHDRCA